MDSIQQPEGSSGTYAKTHFILDIAWVRGQGQSILSQMEESTSPPNNKLKSLCKDWRTDVLAKFYPLATVQHQNELKPITDHEEFRAFQQCQLEISAPVPKDTSTKDMMILLDRRLDAVSRMTDSEWRWNWVCKDWRVTLSRVENDFNLLLSSFGIAHSTTDSSQVEEKRSVPADFAGSESKRHRSSEDMDMDMDMDVDVKMEE